MPQKELDELLKRQVRREPDVHRELACGFAVVLNESNELIELHMQWPLTPTRPPDATCSDDAQRDPIKIPWRSYTIGELGTVYSISGTLFVRSSTYPLAVSVFSIRFRNRDGEVCHA